MTREENLVQLENLRRFCEFCSKQRTRMLCREDVEALQFAIDFIKNQESEKERIIKELEENFEKTVEPHHFETDREEMWHTVGFNKGIVKAIEIVKRGGGSGKDSM